MNNLNNQHIKFHNNTYLPVIVETWLYNPQLTNVVIGPFEHTQLYSCTGEWYINYRFNEEPHIQLWKQFYTDKSKNNVDYSYYLGKFRNTPCIQGGYSWIEDEHFECLYFNGIIEFKETSKK